MSTQGKPPKPEAPSRETMHEIVEQAIMSHSSPAIDNSDAHGARGQSAYLVVENHVQFIAHEIAEKLGERQIELTVCRGCNLSNELYVLTDGRGCELCDGGEKVTAELIRDLASRIPYPDYHAKTGANPLLEVSKEFDVPLDAVYSYAGWAKRHYLNKGLPVDPTYWEAKAAEKLKEVEMGLLFTGRISRIRMLMFDFIQLQSSTCS